MTDRATPMSKRDKEIFDNFCKMIFLDDEVEVEKVASIAGRQEQAQPKEICNEPNPSSPEE